MDRSIKKIGDLMCLLGEFESWGADSDESSSGAASTKPLKPCELHKSFWRLCIVPNEERFERWCRMRRSEAISLVREMSSSGESDDVLLREMTSGNKFTIFDRLGSLMIHLAHGEIVPTLSTRPQRTMVRIRRLVAR